MRQQLIEGTAQVGAWVFLKAFLRGALRDSSIYGEAAIRELVLVEIGLQMDT